MSELPVPKSQPQILGAIVDAFCSEEGITDLQTGNPLLSIFEAASLANFQTSGTIFQLLSAISLDKATGLALIRIGEEENVAKQLQSPATGTVTIGDSSFTKLESRVYQGLPGPIIGATSLHVTDATLWPATGSVYIGRGTSNYEGALAYSSKTDNGTHWTLVLTSPTTRLHNIGENVVVAQGGNRSIGSSTIVKTPQANINDSVTFRVLYTVTLPDGENSLTGVKVVAEKPGIIGNVAAGAINQFSSTPFVGATVTNPLPYSNGLETEDDDSYRERIKTARRTRTKGTALAIASGVTGITAADENKRVSSASLVTRSGYPTTLYIDDGTGYEEISTGVAVEVLVDSAIGGEQFFQAKRSPIAKAFLISRNAAPYVLSDEAELTVRVGGTTYTHRFDESEFKTISNATANEVVSSINANELLGFSARTSDSQARVVLFAKGDTNEEIEVIAGVTEVFRFPQGVAYSLQVYKNDRILTKDGRSAVYNSNPLADWDSFTGSKTLVLAIDGTPEQTYTFTDADFVDGNTGYTTVGKNSEAAWVTVINNKIPGVTARLDGGRIQLTSNLGPSGRAAVEIVSGSLVAVRMFVVGIVQGTNRDYTVDRNTSQIRLESVLVAGDRLSIGTSSSRSFLESLTIPATTTASDAELWFSVDGDATRIAHGLSSSVSLTLAVDSVHDWGHRLKISASSAVFINVSEGDWMVGWDSLLPTGLQGNFRVAEVERDTDGSVLGSYIVLERKGANVARSGHQAVALDPVGGDFSVSFITGGYTRSHIPELGTYVEGVTAACEYFDTNGGNFRTLAPSMTRARAYHTATVLNDGKVLVAGGVSSDWTALNSTELFDPSTETWTGGPNLPEGVYYHTATKLLTGDVLFAGGYRHDPITGDIFSGMACRYNAGANTITNFPGTQLTDARAQHRAALLADGRVLIVGGKDETSTLVSAEIYDAAGPSTTLVTALNSPRRHFGITNEDAGGKILAIGNHHNEPDRATYEIYDVGADTWTIAPIDATKDVQVEDQDIYVNAAGTPIVFGAWYQDVSGYHSEILYFDGADWDQYSGNAINTDTQVHWEKKWVELYKNDLSSPNFFVGVGGLNATQYAPAAQIERVDTNASPDYLEIEDAVDSSLTLSSPPGVAFVRTLEPLQRFTLAAGANYTAPSLVAALNAELVGATASVYRTGKLRVTTNSFGLEGDVALVAANALGDSTFKISTADAIDNLVGHTGSVESANAEAGTPTFEEVLVQGVANEADADFVNSLVLNASVIDGGTQLVGLRNHWTRTATSFEKRYGNELNSRIKSGFVAPATTDNDSTVFDTRNAPPARDYMPMDRFYAATPYAITHEDDLVVQIDGESNKRYSVKMGRKIKATTNTYGFQNIYKDVDGGVVSLAATFGLDYDFNDFVVYMKARAVAFSGDANRKALFRYFKHGPDGEFARVRFANPTAANASVAVTVDSFQFDAIDVRVKVASGAARTPSLRATTRLAYACTAQTNSVGTLVFAVGFATTQAQRTDAGDDLRVRVQLPPLVTTSGVTVGSVLYLASTNGSFGSGAYTVTSVAAASGPGGTQDIHFTDTTVGDVTVGASIGTLSLDSQGACLFSGVGITAGDFFRIGSDSSVQSSWEDNTYCITTVAAQHVICTSGERVFESSDVNPALVVQPLNLASNLQIFASSAQTITAITAAVNAAAALVNSKCPITMTSLGTGSGTVAKSTPDELLVQDWYVLTDGINWISKTDSPLTIAGDYTLSFKQAITGSLATGADWQNEDVRICPLTSKNVAGWLNTPTVTGLYASALVQVSSDGAKVQIASRKPGSAGSVHVQGGLANGVSAVVKGDTADLNLKGASTVLKTGTAGMASGQWVSIDNNYTLPKQNIFSSGSELQSWSSDGLITMDNPVFTTFLDPVNVKLAFEKQGNFLALSVPDLDVESFSVETANRDAAGSLYTLTLRIPTGLEGSGYEVGDFFEYDATTSHAVIAADRVNATSVYTLTLRLPPGHTTCGYLAGDSFFLESNNAFFPSGTYTVDTVNAPSGDTQTIEFIEPAASDETVSFAIGTAQRTDPDFGGTYPILAVGIYDSFTQTQTIQYNATALTDLTRQNLGQTLRTVDWSNINEGDMVRITSSSLPSLSWDDKQVPIQNVGLFRVVRVEDSSDFTNRAGTIWIENTDAVEGTFEARVSAYSYDSILPGDELIVNSDIWGSQNKGTWIVEKVGVANAASTDEFADAYSQKFVVSATGRTPMSIGNPGPLGADEGLVQIIEGVPSRLFKQIVGIAPNQDDGTYSDVRWSSGAHLNQISSTAGSVITVLDKLAFSTVLAAGVDGYAYNTGLIGEANRVVYGDPSDTSTYPGIAAAGAQININGPLVKRLVLALQLRVRTGSSPTDVANRVRSAVAAYVNQVGIGKSIAISAIIAAASKVVGVVAVTMVSPTFDVANDLIAVQPFEKPLIANLQQDISITFVGV